MQIEIAWTRVSAIRPLQSPSPYRAELNAQLGPRQQEMLDGTVKPTDVFTEVSEAIRAVIVEEKA